MKINKRFNQLKFQEYRDFINNHQKYTDFNTLGLYRSILENEQLGLEEKIQIRDLANEHFGKFFEFLQIKDVSTYIGLTTLENPLTVGQLRSYVAQIKYNQQRILAKKRIKHRNFGDYARHNCGYAHCPLNGLMVRQGSPLSEGHLRLPNDKSRSGRQFRSKLARKNRKNRHQLNRQTLEHSEEKPR